MRVFRCIVRGRSILSALCIFHNYLLFWRCVTISSKELQINDEIRDKELRIIDTDGSQSVSYTHLDVYKRQELI